MNIIIVLQGCQKREVGKLCSSYAVLLTKLAMAQTDQSRADNLHPSRHFMSVHVGKTDIHIKLESIVDEIRVAQTNEMLLLHLYVCPRKAKSSLTMSAAR